MKRVPAVIQKRQTGNNNDSDKGKIRHWDPRRPDDTEVEFRVHPRGWNFAFVRRASSCARRVHGPRGDTPERDDDYTSGYRRRWLRQTKIAWWCINKVNYLDRYLLTRIYTNRTNSRWTVTDVHHETRSTCN